MSIVDLFNSVLISIVCHFQWNFVPNKILLSTCEILRMWSIECINCQMILIFKIKRSANNFYFREFIGSFDYDKSKRYNLEYLIMRNLSSFLCYESICFAIIDEMYCLFSELDFIYRKYLNTFDYPIFN